MNVHATADIITRAAERMGYSVRHSFAATGSIYLSLSHESAPDRTIRVADHGECYCREDWSCDPQGDSKESIVTMLAADCGGKAPGWVARNEAAKAAAAAQAKAAAAASAAIYEAHQAQRNAAIEWLKINEPATMERWWEKSGKKGKAFRQAAIRRAQAAMGGVSA